MLVYWLYISPVVFVSCVHPVAILRAVFCTVCSLSRMHWVTIWYSEYGSGYGFVCGEYGFFLVSFGCC